MREMRETTLKVDVEVNFDLVDDGQRKTIEVWVKRKKRDWCPIVKADIESDLGEWLMTLSREWEEKKFLYGFPW